MYKNKYEELIKKLTFLIKENKISYSLRHTSPKRYILRFIFDPYKYYLEIERKDKEANYPIWICLSKEDVDILYLTQNEVSYDNIDALIEVLSSCEDEADKFIEEIMRL